MTEFNFYLSNADTERLFAIMELQGADVSANDFARQILEDEIRRLFPATPKRDANGNITNADKYRGKP